LFTGINRPYLLKNKSKKGRSGIQKYGAANEIEFFSVVSELFFKNPDELEREHP